MISEHGSGSRRTVPFRHQSEQSLKQLLHDYVDESTVADYVDESTVSDDDATEAVEMGWDYWPAGYVDIEVEGVEPGILRQYYKLKREIYSAFYYLREVGFHYDKESLDQVFKCLDQLRQLANQVPEVQAVYQYWLERIYHLQIRDDEMSVYADTTGSTTYQLADQLQFFMRLYKKTGILPTRHSTADDFTPLRITQRAFSQLVTTQPEALEHWLTDAVSLDEVLELAVGNQSIDRIQQQLGNTLSAWAKRLMHTETAAWDDPLSTLNVAVLVARRYGCALPASVRQELRHAQSAFIDMMAQSFFWKDYGSFQRWQRQLVNYELLSGQPVPVAQVAQILYHRWSLASFTVGTPEKIEALNAIYELTNIKPDQAILQHVFLKDVQNELILEHQRVHNAPHRSVRQIILDCRQPYAHLHIPLPVEVGQITALQHALQTYRGTPEEYNEALQQLESEFQLERVVDNTGDFFQGDESKASIHKELDRLYGKRPTMASLVNLVTVTYQEYNVDFALRIAQCIKEKYQVQALSVETGDAIVNQTIQKYLDDNLSTDQLQSAQRDLANLGISFARQVKPSLVVSYIKNVITFSPGNIYQPIWINSALGQRLQWLMDRLQIKAPEAMVQTLCNGILLHAPITEWSNYIKWCSDTFHYQPSWDDATVEQAFINVVDRSFNLLRDIPFCLALLESIAERKPIVPVSAQQRVLERLGPGVQNEVVAKLFHQEKIDFDPVAIQERYRQLLSVSGDRLFENIDLVAHLYQASNFRPDMTPDAVAGIYTRLVVGSSKMSTTYIEQTLGTCKLLFGPAVYQLEGVQSYYDKNIQTVADLSFQNVVGLITHLRWCENRTQVKLTSEQLLRCYNAIAIASAITELDKNNLLKRLASQFPEQVFSFDANTIQRGYQGAWTNSSSFLPYCLGLNSLTGIAPQWERAFLDAQVIPALVRAHPKTAVLFLENFHILLKPIQQVQLLTRVVTDSLKIKEKQDYQHRLLALWNVEPSYDQDQVQSYYLKSLHNRQYDDIQDVRSLTGIDPSFDSTSIYDHVAQEINQYTFVVGNGDQIDSEKLQPLLKTLVTIERFTDTTLQLEQLPPTRNFSVLMVRLLVAADRQQLEAMYSQAVLLVDTLLSTNPEEFFTIRLQLQQLEKIDLRFKPLIKLIQRQPSYKALLRLAGQQLRHPNKDRDPWLLVFKPLIFDLSVSHPDGLTAQDWAGFVRYIQDIGVAKLPRLCTVYVACESVRTCAELSKDVQQLLNDFGIQFELTDTPLVIREQLQQRKQVLAQELLLDVVPPGLDSELGEELLTATLNNKQWTRAHNKIELIRQYKERIAHQPDPLPAAYQATQLVVQENVRESSDMDREEKYVRWLSSEAVRSNYTLLAEDIQRVLQRDDISVWWEETNIELQQVLLADCKALQKVLAAAETANADLTELTPEQSQLLQRVLEKPAARIGIERQLQSLQASVEVMRTIHLDATPHEAEYSSIMEKITSLQLPDALKAKTLRTLSVAHMLDIDMAGWDVQLRDRLGAGIEPDRARLQWLAQFSRQYIAEHYLHAGQDVEHSGHKPFSTKLSRALQSAWQQVTDTRKQFAIEQLVANGEHILQPNPVTLSDSYRTVGMVPVNGIYKIFSGDIGDACYTSKHEALATGEHPNLHAWIYTETQADQVDCVGSLLAVEARQADTAIPALIARANNPKESFIRELYADQFVLAALQEVVATARRLRRDRIAAGTYTAAEQSALVCLPMDAVGKSATNRPSVMEVYDRRFRADTTKIFLQNTPDTNFNGYDIWNATSSHAVVKIWEIDAMGNETWYGNWMQEKVELEERQAA